MTSTPKSGLPDAYWQTPTNTDVLKAWATDLEKEGDPRGAFVQLCLGGASAEERKVVQKKQGGKLVGPARPYLREWSFGPHGVVDQARCEAIKLVEGVEEIRWVHPRLILTVTSVKKKAVYEQLAKVSLAGIHWVDFDGFTGSHGGTEISTKALTALAPAFAGVRNLSLSCRGYQKECFSPQALATLGDHAEGIEFLSINYSQCGLGKYDDPDLPRIAPIDEYAEVIATHPGFKTLKAVKFVGADPAQLEGMPNLVSLNTSDWSRVDAEGLERLKTGAG